MAELWTRDYISPDGDERMNFTAFRKIAYNAKDETTFTIDEASAILKAAGKDISDYELDTRDSLILKKDVGEELLNAAGKTIDDYKLNAKGNLVLTKDEAVEVISVAGRTVNDYGMGPTGLTLHKDEVTNLLIAGGNEFVREIDSAGFNASR